MRFTRRSHTGTVHSVTTAKMSASEDRHRREQQYLAMMALRMACIGVAFLVPGPLRWVALAGAVLLPWFAVLIANGRGAPATSITDPGPGAALPARVVPAQTRAD